MVALTFQSRFLLIFCAAGFLLPWRGVAQEPEQPARTTFAADLPLSTAIVPNKDSATFRVVPKTAHWNGQEFDIETGIEVLMAVIKDPTTSTDERALAVRHLGNLNTLLSGQPCIDDLVALYPKVTTVEIRYRLLLCLLRSEDSRGLPLFYSVLEAGTAESRLRLRAAAALAQWNIRRGVLELIELFPNEERGPMRTLGADAMMLFEYRNRSKGWGCPVEEIMKPATAMSKQDHDAGVALAMKGFRDWFEANRQRFPDWKPGDPLPKAPKVKATPMGGH